MLEGAFLLALPEVATLNVSLPLMFALDSFQSTDYPMVNCPATVLPVYFHPGGNGEGCPPFMENAQECSHLPPHTHRSPLKELSKMRQMPLQGSNAKRSRVWDGSGSHTSNGGFRFSGPLHSIPSTPSRRNAFYSGSTGNKIKGNVSELTE